MNPLQSPDDEPQARAQSCRSRILWLLLITLPRPAYGLQNRYTKTKEDQAPERGHQRAARSSVHVHAMRSYALKLQLWRNDWPLTLDHGIVSIIPARCRVSTVTPGDATRRMDRAGGPVAKQASRAAWPRPASVGGVVPFLLLTAEKSFRAEGYGCNWCNSGHALEATSIPIADRPFGLQQL